MFGEFLNIFFRSLKLDKSLYKDNINFGEAAIYFAGLIMILDGVAGAVAANTIVKTSISLSGLTAIFTWLVWSIFVYVIGVKLFPDKESKVPFKNYHEIIYKNVEIMTSENNNLSLFLIIVRKSVGVGVLTSWN